MKQFRDTEYYVSKDGKVYSHKYNKIKELKYHINKKGYCSARFRINKNTSNHYIHRMVAECYLDDYSEDLQVNHINLDKSDNRLENLEMVTPIENIRHYYKNTVEDWVCRTRKEQQNDNYIRYYQENKTKIKDKRKKYYQENKEKIQKYQKEYYKRKKYYQENKEKIQKYQKEYYKNKKNQ